MVLNNFLLHDAMLAQYMLLSCVYLSDTSRHCAETAKIRITQTKLYYIPGTLVFWCQKFWRNSNWVTPNGGAKQKWGRLKAAVFDQYFAISKVVKLAHLVTVYFALYKCIHYYYHLRNGAE